MRRRRGFTLIELLVVVAIIAIIAAILFPVFGRVREKSRQATCFSNLGQIRQAVLIYISDYDETFPFVLNGAANFTPAALANVGDDGKPVIRGVTGQEPQYQLVTVMAPYVRNPNVWYCPTVGPDFVWEYPAKQGWWTKGARTRDQGTSYQYNYLAFPPHNPSRFVFFGGKSLGILREPARWPMLFDIPAGYSFNAADPPPDALPHSGGLDVAYGDGHVKFYRMGTAGPDAGFWESHSGDGVLPGQ